MKTVKAEVTWTYYKNGQLRSEEYRIDGKNHNENGPAYRSWYDNGKLRSESYYINGKLHNENGPAYKYWYKNGQLMSESYYIDGKKLTKEEFDKRNTISCSCEGKVVEIDGKKYQLKEI